MNEKDIVLYNVDPILAQTKYQGIGVLSSIECVGKRLEVKLPPSHVLYDLIVDLHALYNFRGRRDDNNLALAKRAYEKCLTIIQFLQSNPKIPMNDTDEQLRWSHLLAMLDHAIRSIHLNKIAKVDLFDVRARKLCKALKPHYHANHRNLTRYSQSIKFDLDLLMGRFHCQYNNLSLAEAYYNNALRNMPKCIVEESTQKSCLYTIYAGITEIHFKSGDFLAAEIQYDYAVRFISESITLVKFSENSFDSKTHIHYHDLANHYLKFNQWDDEKRLLTKTLEVCDLYIDVSGTSDAEFISGAKTIRSECKLRLNSGVFFNDMPEKLKGLVASMDIAQSQITLKTLDSYQKYFAILKSAGLLNEDECLPKTFCLKININQNSNISQFFKDALIALFPKSKKPAKPAKPAKPKPTPTPTADTIDNNNNNAIVEHKKAYELQPQQHISNWKQQKQTTARQNRGGKSAALPKDNTAPRFFIDQHRAVPARLDWEDKIFGNIVFENANPQCEVIILRNEHNCGKPVFGMLPIALIRAKLCQHYRAEQAEVILSEIQKAFSEAKQAGFFGRGLKSCTTLPELRGTDYKLVLKPSRDFKPIFRLFGRHITTQSGHTLYILDAINCHPKSAASKIEYLRPDDFNRSSLTRE